MKFSILQLNPTIGDFPQNAKNILAALNDVHSNERPDLAITPEMSLWGYPPMDYLYYDELLENSKKWLKKIAIEADGLCPVLIGSVEKAEDKKYGGDLLNVSYLIQNGNIKKICSKKLLPYYDVFNEPRYFQSAEGPGSFVVNEKKVTVSICEDFWLGEEFHKGHSKDDEERMVTQRPDFVIGPSASPFVFGKPYRRTEIQSQLSKKFGTIVITVNQVGANDHLIFDGHSLVTDELGNVLYRCKGFEEEVVTVDMGKYPLKNPKIPKPHETKSEFCYKALILGIKDYFRKNGFRKAFLGLSGGVDSALVACLAAHALGPENVTGVILPTGFNSALSKTDAEDLIKSTKINSMEIGIENLRIAYEDSLEKAMNEKLQGPAMENVQPRIRGTLLMAIANSSNGLLLTTGNKSEIAVGYCTIYGDMCGALAVIGDVYKTEVFELCRYINREFGNQIPESIITKPPSAELRPDQKDSDSLPEYEDLDPILYMMIELEKSPQSLIDQGLDKETVQRVSTLLRISEFKRKQAAPVLKVSRRDFTSAWQIPITAAGLLGRYPVYSSVS